MLETLDICISVSLFAKANQDIIIITNSLSGCNPLLIEDSKLVWFSINNLI